MAKNELHVRLKSNGDYWQACWTDSAGKVKAKSLGPKAELTKRAAKVQCQRLAGDMQKNPGRRDVGRSPRLREHLDRYLKQRTDLKATTLELHTKTCEYLAGRTIPAEDPAQPPEIRKGFFEPTLRLDAITRAAAADWRTWLGKQGITETTVCGHVRIAKTIFNRAVDEDLVPFNPFGRLKGTAPDVEKDWRELSADDIRKLLDAAPDSRWKALIALCSWAGLRRSEAMALRWTDVQWDRGRLIVRNAGGVVTTKSKQREVLLEPELEKVLLDAREAHGETGELVAPVSQFNLHPILHKIIERAGLEAWKHPYHTLRKFRDTTWKLKYPEYVVDAWLGHSLEVSRKHYVKVPEGMYGRAQDTKPAEAQTGTTREDAA